MFCCPETDTLNLSGIIFYQTELNETALAKHFARVAEFVEGA
jgi:hypothetical protein